METIVFKQSDTNRLTNLERLITVCSSSGTTQRCSSSGKTQGYSSAGTILVIIY